MKKCVVLAAVVALLAIAVPVFAATNPFIDVPLNHWSYDAIGQLAAKGILSGYPDGTYKGKQPTTRFEMASALARALAVVDMTKASRQDVEMLKRLVVEFKDELDALGVKVDALDARVGKLESRLGGWKLSGVLRLQIDDRSEDDQDGAVNLSRGRLFFERWYGEDESLKLNARLNILSTGIRWELLNAVIPVWGDSTLTSGRVWWDLENAYYLNGQTPWLNGWVWGQDSWLTDRITDAFTWQKSLGLGKVIAYVGRPHSGNEVNGDEDFGVNAWEFFAKGEFQFTEQLGFDLGVQYFLGDDVSVIDAATTENLDHLFTVFGGLRFAFNEGIQLKGLYYYQDLETTTAGVSNDQDSTSAYRIIVDVKQDFLKFTSLWLEYDYLDRGFAMPGGTDALWMGRNEGLNAITGSLQRVDADTSIFRVAATQTWTEKWKTALYFAYHDWDDATSSSATEWALGVGYQYTPNVGFALAFSHIAGDDHPTFDEETVIRFRTQVTF
jgi:hypothetical protein